MNFLLVNIVYNQLKHYFPHWTIKVGAGTEAVGLFESIHLFVASDQITLQNAISGVKRRARLCLEQNGEYFHHMM
jgi:hypothetical protein